MKPHIIVDPARPVLVEKLSSINHWQNFESVQVWDPVRDSNSTLRSINLSHKQIVSYAKQNKLKEICILEEDVMFTAPDSWDMFLAHKPEKFDIYLGGAYGLNNTALKRIQQEAGTDMIAAEIHNFAGLHCYVISENYYDRFLDTPEDKHIDDQAGRGRFFVCFPFVALQNPGWSSNNRKIQDYNADLKPEFIYYGKGNQGSKEQGETYY